MALGIFSGGWKEALWARFFTAAPQRQRLSQAIQHSQASLRALVWRYGINQKTAKWKGRSSVADLPTGSKDPRSTVLSIEDEAVVVTFRRHTLQPLDDCLYALQATIPHLTRSSLHRCLQRHGSAVCLRWKVRRRSRGNSRHIRSGSSVLPHRHRRGADCGRKALSLRCHRPDQQVRPSSTGGPTASRHRPSSQRSSK